MNPNLHGLERFQLVSGWVPSTMTTARTSDVISLKNYGRVGILFHKGIGTAGDDPTLTILQGTSIAFGTNKALTFTTLYVKQDPTSLGDVGQWTKVTQSAANTYTDATVAEQAALWYIEFKAEDLDIANDYDCIRVSCSDIGTTTADQFGALLFILMDPRQQMAPEDMLSAIID